jgi:hypothetical protein
LSKEKTWKGAVKYLKVAAAGTLLASIGSAYTFETVSAASNTSGDVKVEQMFEQSKILSGVKFKDVNADYWASDSIKWASARGLISGYDDGSFKPNAVLTEAQFAAIISRYYDELSTEVKGYNSKVKTPKHWSEGNYDALAKYNVPLLGYDDSFYKNSPVMRGLIAQVVSHVNGADTDLEGAIYYLFDEGITVGKNVNGKTIYEKFGHTDHLTRAQAVVFFHRLFTKEKTTLAPTVVSSKVVDKDPVVQAKKVSVAKVAAKKKVDPKVVPKKPVVKPKPKPPVVKPKPKPPVVKPAPAKPKPPVVKPAPPKPKPPVVKPAPPKPKPPVVVKPAPPKPKPPVVVKPPVASPVEKVLKTVYVGYTVTGSASNGYSVLKNGVREAFTISTTYRLVDFQSDASTKRASKAISNISGKITEADMNSLFKKSKDAGGDEVSKGSVSLHFNGSEFVIQW